MGSLISSTVNVSINCDPRKVYEFVSNPENLPRWAKAFCRSIKKSDSEWIAETPQGPMKISFARRNNFGVLDHYVDASPSVQVFVPMRVVPNGEGSEVLFTLFQSADISEDRFAEDRRWVEQDLQNLKDIMEKSEK